MLENNDIKVYQKITLRNNLQMCNHKNCSSKKIDFKKIYVDSMYIHCRIYSVDSMVTITLMGKL